MTAKTVISPFDADIIGELHSGDELLITGTMYVARDAAHARMIDALQRGEPLPFDVNGQTIYYMGPSPAPPGYVIGAAGPTTSGRMDVYTPRLIEEGLRVMIGKGARSAPVTEALQKYHAVYCAAIGGAGALLSQCIVKADVIAYEDLGAEALRRIEVKNFPAIVINDMYGADLYEKGKAAYRKRAGTSG
jgi:fumarate hydratase subunit beta